MRTPIETRMDYIRLAETIVQKPNQLEPRASIEKVLYAADKIRAWCESETKCKRRK